MTTTEPKDDEREISNCFLLSDVMNRGRRGRLFIVKPWFTAIRGDGRKKVIRTVHNLLNGWDCTLKSGGDRWHGNGRSYWLLYYVYEVLSQTLIVKSQHRQVCQLCWYLDLGQLIWQTPAGHELDVHSLYSPLPFVTRSNSPQLLLRFKHFFSL